MPVAPKQQRWPRRRMLAVMLVLIRQKKKKERKKRKFFPNTTYLVKHIFELVLRQRTALDVFNRAEVLRHTLTVLSADGGHLLLGKLLSDAGVISQIDLSSNNEAGNARAVVVNLREPLLANVFE